MAEIMQPAGVWTFDGETLRIVPGTGRGVPPLRRALGEVTVPLRALAGIVFEPHHKRGGRLRLRLRAGADPLSHVAGGRLPESSDPYQLPVEDGRGGVAEYLVDEVRQALLLDQIPDTPTEDWLLSGPSVPLTASASDGTAFFDGEEVTVEWNWVAEEHKKSGGPRRFTLAELKTVEWTPSAGLENGSLRFHPHGSHAMTKPDHDPNCLTLWGVRQAKDASCVLLAAAVVARLPHPLASDPPAEQAGLPSGRAAQEAEGAVAAADPASPGADHDDLLRRLRKLGELRTQGVLTEEEFTAAKKAVLARF